MSVTHRSLELRSRAGDPIRGDVQARANDNDGAAIVVCHGFKGFKDWGFFPYVCEQLAERTGYPVVSFNFSLNGIGKEPQTFTELEMFARNTFSREMDDLKVVLDAITAGRLPGLTARSRFGLLGHSRGGVSTIITSAEDDRIHALVTWSAVSHVDRWDEEQRTEWRRKGRIEVLNARTGQMMPLGIELLEDVEQNRDRLDVLAAVSRLNVPYLILHGSHDESVSVSEAEEIRAAHPGDGVRLERIDGAGHTYGAVHPFEGSTDHLDRVIDLSVEWFCRHLV
jgi:pimeloyl-ACP methyl ester carboxylesterase